MSRWLASAAVLALVGVAGTADLDNQPPLKTVSSFPENVSDPARQGGDTIFDAFVIAGIPFSDTGTTAGFTDDYDEVCPYSGSTSPDVVYRFTPSYDAWPTVDLCGSSYDTKLYISDPSLDLVACNDDYYFDDTCGMYVSRLENVPLQAGEDYYIVIDGYGGDYGDYVLDVVEYSVSFPPCPDDGVPEGEPTLVNEYVDTYNGGCNSPESGTPFQALTGDDQGEIILCGVTGWYLVAGSDHRDSDWFLLVMGPDGGIGITADGEYATYVFELAPPDCETVVVVQQIQVGPVVPGTMTITGYAPGEVVWLWVGPTTFTPPSGPAPQEYDYLLWLSGLEVPVATEAASWSAVKALYR